MEDKDVLDAMEAFKIEAMKNALNAFNEGFMYGRRYAEQLYKKES